MHQLKENGIAPSKVNIVIKGYHFNMKRHGHVVFQDDPQEESSFNDPDLDLSTHANRTEKLSDQLSVIDLDQSQRKKIDDVDEEEVRKLTH